MSDQSRPLNFTDGLALIVIALFLSKQLSYQWWWAYPLMFFILWKIVYWFLRNYSD